MIRSYDGRARARERKQRARAAAVERREDDWRRGHLVGKPVLVLANKQDAPGAHEPDAVAAALDLDGYQADCAGSHGAFR